MSSTESEMNGAGHKRFPNGFDRDVTVFVSSYFPPLSCVRVASVFVIVCKQPFESAAGTAFLNISRFPLLKGFLCFYYVNETVGVNGFRPV